MGIVFKSSFPDLNFFCLNLLQGGAMQMSEKLRDIVGKDNVLIGEPVTKIDQSDKDMIRVTTATGKDFKCRYIINTAPLHCSGEYYLSFHFFKGWLWSMIQLTSQTKWIKQKEINL